MVQYLASYEKKRGGKEKRKEGIRRGGLLFFSFFGGEEGEAARLELFGQITSALIWEQEREKKGKKGEGRRCAD